MSWMMKLYETYDAGIRLDLPGDMRLMPASHTMQNAHINIIININGKFERAEIFNKQQIILPATEKSANARTGTKPPPHPFADKVQYVARTYPQKGGLKPSFFSDYIELLRSWCESRHSHRKVEAVYSYVTNCDLIDDLSKHSVLVLKEDGLLLTPTTEELKSLYDDFNVERPAIFGTIPKDDKSKRFDQGSALVCWSVEVPGDFLSKTWQDESIYDAWTNFEIERLENANRSLCYVTGKFDQIIAKNHPAKIRNSGDAGKLISSNDKEGFTFRGRFTDDKKSLEKLGTQSVAISAEATQKAHNALQWLVKRQGYRNGDQSIVAWAVSCAEIPPPLDDSFSFLGDEITEVTKSCEIADASHNVDLTADLGQYFSIALKKRLSGYQAKLPQSDSIIVMGVDSATPGRMAITYYQELAPLDFIERLAKWYLDFSWFQRRSVHITDSKGKEKNRTEWHPGTPAPKEIAEAIFGDTISDSLKKNTVERLLPCIIEGKPLPRDFSDKAFRKAVNRQSYASDQQWLWEKNLGIACCLFKGFCKRSPNHMRDYSMALEEDNCSRDYLFGRLLAIAERIEEVALSVADENRSTTAARLMQRFADRPASTWRNIELALQPYIQRLKSKRAGFLHNQLSLLDEVMGKFTSDNFSSDKPLTGEFLLAFHTQRLDLKKKPELNIESETVN